MGSVGSGVGVGLTGSEFDDGDGFEGEIPEEVEEGLWGDGHECIEVLFERPVIFVVDPLCADGAHATERYFALQDDAGGDFVFCAIHFVISEVGFDALEFVDCDAGGVVGALGVADEGEVVASAAVVGVEAEIGLFGDGVIDESPVEA